MNRPSDKRPPTDESKDAMDDPSLIRHIQAVNDELPVGKVVFGEGKVSTPSHPVTVLVKINPAKIKDALYFLDPEDLERTLEALRTLGIID